MIILLHVAYSLSQMIFSNYKLSQTTLGVSTWEFSNVFLLILFYFLFIQK
jgi:hypothetical protein